ncbi:MAG: peptidylprolyl isomerase [Verrucomicrobiota bacterium]
MNRPTLGPRLAKRLGWTLLGMALSVLSLTAAQSRNASKSTLFDKPQASGAPLFADDVVAKGKGFEIKQSQIDEMYVAFKGHRAAMGEAVPDDLRPRIEADILEKLIATRLFLIRATEQDKTKAKEIANAFIAEQRKQVPSEESFRRQLMAVGMTTNEYTTQLHEQAIVKAVIDREIKAGKKVTDAEAKKFYADNPNLFQEAETVRAAHILIPTRDTVTGKELTPELKLERRRLADKVLARAKAGEDFAKLVREFSADQATKSRGGEYTFSRAKDDPRRAMAAEFEAAAFSMKPGQISDPVETGFGYHIIKLIEKTPAKKTEYAKVEERIKESLLREAVEKELPNYIEKLKKEAGVQVLLSDAKK